MSEPFKKKNKMGLSMLVGIVIAATVVVVIAIIGFIGYKFITYKDLGGIPTADSSIAQVAISAPPQGGQLEIGDIVTVEATAIGATPFSSIELWINGELMGVQAAPSGGVHPFSTSFSWMPNEAGVYSLSATAMDVDGNKDVSAQVIAHVVQSEPELELIGSDLPTVLPAPSGGGYSPPSGPGASEATGPAEIWSGSTGDWVTSLTAKVKPEAPVLIVNGAKCTAELQIHDLSENEEGFAVYRQTGMSPMWVKVATLSSQSDFDWITYTDEGLYGAVNYYVTAFNSKGESKSNFSVVSIDPTDCASESEEQAVGTLGVMLQIPNQSAENIYCYRSYDGINWSRWPQFGFLLPSGGPSGALMYDMQGGGQEDQEDTRIGGPIMHMMMQDLSGEPVSPQMSLFMECWGWQESELQYIGKLGAQGIKPQADVTTKILGEGLFAEVSYSPVELLAISDFSFEIKNERVEDLWKKPVQMGFLKLIGSEVPKVNLSVTRDKEICGKYLPPYVQSHPGLMLFCFSYPEYDPDKGGITDQPYLVWDFDIKPICVGGTGEECKTYQELLDLVEDNGGQVGFTITSMTGGIKKVWNVTEPNLTMFVVPPLACIGDTEFNVRMWYRPGNEGVGEFASQGDQISEIGGFEISPAEIRYGPYSNVIKIPCNNSGLPTPSIIKDIQYVDVTFESMKLRNIDDDDLEAQTVELYGYLRVTAPSMGNWENICSIPEWCGDIQKLVGTHQNLLVADWGADGMTFFNGLSTFYERELCLSTGKLSCTYEGQHTSYEYHNNTIRVFVKDGDALNFEALLVDYDEASDDDKICKATKTTPSYSIDEWAAVDENYTLYGLHFNDGNCEVEVNIRAVNP